MEKVVTDKDSIQKIMNTLFGRLPVSLEAEGRLTQIRVIGMKSALELVVQIPDAEFSPNRLITVVHNGHLLKAECRISARGNNGIEILSAERILILPAERTEARLEMSGNVSITNIINQNAIRKALGFLDKSTDTIIQKYKAKLNQNFEHVSVFFSERMDNRLRVMNNFEANIFVQNRYEQQEVPDGFVPFDEYQKLLAMNKIGNEFISDISVMILYKGYVPMGYIQILSKEELTIDDFNMTNLMANAIAKETIQSGVFQESKEKCIVNDLSHQGLGFFHPQSIFFSRAFAVGETILFDLLLANSKKMYARAILRNITNQDKGFKLGCQFFNLTERDQNLLQEFLDSGSEDA